jgi:type IV pilus assembly protein PilZ
MAGKKTTKKNPLSPAEPENNKRSSGNRIPIQLLVDYKCDGHYLFDFCRDLGSGGVFIETVTPQNHGSNLDLTFTIPDSKETLRTSGKVIWVQSPVKGRADLIPGMGVQFEAFNNEQRTILEEFVRRYHGDEFGGLKDRSVS